MNQKPLFLAVALTVLIILALGAGVYVWKGQQKEATMSYSQFLGQYGERVELPKVDTTGWTTYQDEDFGFELQYPADEWEVYRPEMGRQEIERYKRGERQEKKRPNDWDNLKRKFTESPIICIEKKGGADTSLDDTNRGRACHGDIAGVVMSANIPVWGNETAEELWVRQLIESRQDQLNQLVMGTQQYIEVDGVNIGYNPNGGEFMTYTKDGIQLRIRYNGLLLEKAASRSEWQKTNLERENLLQSIIQTLHRLD